MSRLNNSADALIEILQFCEQTLTALVEDHPHSGLPASVNILRPSTTRASGGPARQLVLIQGGLLDSTQKTSRGETPLVDQTPNP